MIGKADSLSWLWDFWQLSDYAGSYLSKFVGANWKTAFQSSVTNKEKEKQHFLCIQKSERFLSQFASMLFMVYLTNQGMPVQTFQTNTIHKHTKSRNEKQISSFVSQFIYSIYLSPPMYTKIIFDVYSYRTFFLRNWLSSSSLAREFLCHSKDKHENEVK